MDRYIGLDVHRDSCTVAVVGRSGKRLKSYVVETNGSALVEVIRCISGRRHICLEEGTQSAWLYEILSPHAEEVVVVVPEKRRGAKSDKRDAWTRAEELRTGAIVTRVYKAPRHLAALKNAVRGHLMAVRDVVRAVRVNDSETVAGCIY
jgi:transposase